MSEGYLLIVDKNKVGFVDILFIKKGVEKWKLQAWWCGVVDLEFK